MPGTGTESEQAGSSSTLGFAGYLSPHQSSSKVERWRYRCWVMEASGHGAHKDVLPQQQPGERGPLSLPVPGSKENPSLSPPGVFPYASRSMTMFWRHLLSSSDT